MSASLYPWIIIGHLVGIVLWLAGLVAVFGLLSAHSHAEPASRARIVSEARRLAAMMEVGSVLAIGLGLYLAFASPMYPQTAFKSGGWLHVKLLLVVVGILGSHVVLRIKLKRARLGRGEVVPRVLLSVMVVCTIGAIALGAHPTLLRKAPSVPAQPSTAAPVAPPAG